MIKNDYKIYDFNLDFHAELLLLAKKAWHFTYSNIMKPDVLNERLNDWYSEQNHKGISENVKNGKYFFKVVFLNKQMVGFVSGNVNEQKLDRLYIDPDEIGKGLGALLLQMFIDELIKVNKKTCLLYCDKNNSIGIKFYKKKGFVIVEEDEEDYKMVKNIEVF
ncbi:GNAT family N-acetyltransferase [Treponema zuelzerae]|uniref:GNAT family N-acetyltransferase n=1 Tax=Teretinema zuelzerae TaxID=156 RepID=A0AAE3EMB4_9SPIR|nr:GNAT family N-acetyltransferase [Teretinema zuelzerae]MCD1656093.1 GNAT family N-acetyltransferase [Teretinema zuelzerae]